MVGLICKVSRLSSGLHLICHSEERTGVELGSSALYFSFNSSRAKDLFLNVHSIDFSHIRQMLTIADSPRFYATVGLKAHAFDYNIASATCGWAGCLIGIILSDYFGRRCMLIWGGLAQVPWLFLIAGLGDKKHPSSSDAHGLVAGVMLFIFVFTGSAISFFFFAIPC